MSRLPGFSELSANADRLRPEIPVAVMGAADESVIAAMKEATQRGWVRPMLCGPQAVIEQLADGIQFDLSDCEIIDTETPAHPAVELVTQGRAKMLMKGQVATPDLMRAVLNRETGLRTGKLVCQMVLMEVLRDRKSFLMTDTGINISTTRQQQCELIEHVIEIGAKLGRESLQIGLMSCTEKPNPAIPESVMAAEIAGEAVSLFGQRAVINGPVSFDIAYSTMAAAKKNMTASIELSTDAMIFPDLMSANLTVKAIMYTAECQYGGILCGTSAPVVFMSRADTPQTRLNSLAYAIGLIATGRE